MKVKDLFKKILGNKKDRRFYPDYSDDEFIKIYLKENDKSIPIYTMEDETISLLTRITNLTLSEDKYFLYITYNKIYDLYIDDKKYINNYSYLNLPPLFDGFINIENKGNFNEDKIVKYTFRFKNGQPDDIKVYKRNILLVNGEYSVLPEDIYVFLKDIIAYNTDNQRVGEIGEQFAFLAKVKEYAEKSNILLNSRLREEEKPILIDKIKLNFREEGDLLEIIPFVEEESEEFNERFLQKFDQSEDIKNFYNIRYQGKSRKVIFKNKASAQKIKQNRILRGEKKSKFCKGENELLYDDENFDLSLYGPRVIGMGYLTYRTNPAPTNDKDESWFDFEKVMDLPKIFTNEEIFILQPEHREILQNKLLELEEKSLEIIDVELEKDGAKNKIPMTKEQIVADISRINKSIIGVDKINSINDLEEIKEKIESEPDKKYIEHKGRYINCTEKNFIVKRIDDLKLKNENKKSESKGKESLIIKENLDCLEYEEKAEKHINDKAEIPESLKISLFEHQKEGLCRLQNLYKSSIRTGFLLADDMGLGKTLQILSFLAWLKEKKEGSPVLMVSPSTLIDNWDNDDITNPGEIQKCFTDRLFSTYKIRGTINEEQLEEIGNNDIVLTSYESLRLNHKLLGRIHWKVMICDEIQKAKNATTLVSIALKAQNSDFKIACSATPIENTTLDLWNIMDFAVPGILGSLKDFKKVYVNKINNLKKYDIEERKAINNSLVEKIENNFLRRSKEDELKGLPEKKIKVYMVAANEIERNKTEELNLLKKQGEPALPLIQKMIALGSHQSLITPHTTINIQDLIAQSSKLKALKVIIDEIRGKDEKVLIFSIFKRMQEIIIMALKHWYGIDTSVVNGTINQDKRKGIFDQFRKSQGFNAIVLSPEVAGVGITLTEANHVIHYTRLWNPAKEAQATDRVYRIGQCKDVYVYYPILTYEEDQVMTFDCEQEYIEAFIESSTKGKTPEEKLNKLLIRKKNLLNNFFLAAGESNVNVTDDWDENDNEDEGSISISNVMNVLSADEFESLCSILYKKQGYQTYLTLKSGDKGVDVFLEKEGKYTLIQCKLINSKNIPAGALREVYGAKNVYSNNLGIKIDKLVVIATAQQITKDVQEFATINGIELIMREQLSKLLSEVKVYYSEVTIENENRFSLERIRREL